MANKGLYRVSRRNLLKTMGVSSIFLPLQGMVRPAFAESTQAIVYVYTPGWSNTAGQTFVGAHILKEVLGYKVNFLAVDPAIAFTALKSGKADVYSSAYLEYESALQGRYVGGLASYANAVAGSFEIVGIAQGPITQGLAVPDYVPISSIEELNAHADKFSRRILAADPGAGTTLAGENSIKTYELNFKISASSQASMEAAIKRAYQRQEWVVATLWEPQSIWSQVNMKYLTDSKKTMMQAALYDLHAVRNGFAEKFPRAFRFFQKFQMPLSDVTIVMNQIDNGVRPEDAAKAWVDSPRGQTLLQGWIS